MPNSDQEMQDQRKNPGMEDSNTMTIDFLRARLLSERSVSKSARQRADELARRVAELEEQLKIVSIQRKKAEKAVAAVLAILENDGINEISDVYDSSSDQETPCESDVVPQRALSWNNHRGTKQPLEKYKESYLRRRSSFSFTGHSSPKGRVGKSRRQIRRRESKSVVEELKTVPDKVDSQENGVGTTLEFDKKSEILRESEAQENQYLGGGSDSGCYEDGPTVTNSDIDFKGRGGDKEIEKALQDQAQLVGRHEEMEKSQSEWEERFRENNSSTPDSCDPGNQSDLTEEREEVKAPVQCLAGTVNSQVQEAKSEVYVSIELPKTQSNGFVPPHGDMPCLGDQKCSSASASESVAQDFTFPISNEKQNQECLDNNRCVPSHISHHHVHSCGSSENQPSQLVSSNLGGSSGREVAGGQSEHHALVPHETSSGFQEVLEALKLAKLSLQPKMSSLPLTESAVVGKAIESLLPGLPLTECGSVGKAIESSLPARKVWNRVDTPAGCSGLSVIPTNYAVEVSKANFLVSSSQPSLANYNPTTGLGVFSDDQIVSNSFMDTRSTFSADNFRPTGDLLLTKHSIDTRLSYSTEDRLLTSQYNDTRSGISTTRPSFSSNLDAGLPLSRQHSYPTFSSYPDRMTRVPSNERFSTFLPSKSFEMSPNLDVVPSSSRQYSYPNVSSHPDLLPRISTHEELSKLRSNRSVWMPPASHTPFQNDHTRPFIYR